MTTVRVEKFSVPDFVCEINQDEKISDPIYPPPLCQTLVAQDVSACLTGHILEALGALKEGAN